MTQPTGTAAANSHHWMAYAICGPMELSYPGLAIFSGLAAGRFGGGQLDVPAEDGPVEQMRLLGAVDQHHLAGGQAF